MDPIHFNFISQSSIQSGKDSSSIQQITKKDSVSPPLLFYDSYKDLFLKELVSKNIVNHEFLLENEKYYKSILLDQQALISLVCLFDKTIKVKPKEILPVFEFNLFELLGYFLNEEQNLKNIEIIGGVVPFILKHSISTILKDLGIISEQMIEQVVASFGQTYSDIDIRIQVALNS